MKVRFFLYRLLAVLTIESLLLTEFAPVIQAYAAARVRTGVATEHAASAPKAAQESAATPSYAAAEALFMQAFNAYINTPADAPAYVLRAREDALQKAARILQEAAAREQASPKTAFPAGRADATARSDPPFVWSSNPGGDTGWTVVAQPEGDREAFERTFQTYVSDEVAATNQVPTYDLSTLPAQSLSSSTSQATATSPAGGSALPPVMLSRYDMFPAQQWSSLARSNPFGPSNKTLANTRPSAHFEVTTNAIDLIQDCDPDADKGEWYFWVEVNGDRHWWNNQSWGDAEPAYPITYTWSVLVNSEADTINLTTGGWEDDNDNGVFDDGDDIIPSISVTHTNSFNWGLGPNYEPQTHVPYAEDSAVSCAYYLHYTIEALPPFFADLSLTMDGPSSVAAGGAMNYQFTVQNAGPFDIGDGSWANLIVDFPEGTTNINAPLCSINDLRATCRIDSIAVGEIIKMDIQADAPMRPGEDVVTDAWLAVPMFTDREDPGYGNNGASVTAHILPLADVYVDMAAPRAVTVIPGGSATYQVQATVGNNGPTYAPAAHLAITPPGNTTVVGLSADAGSCNPGARTCDLGDIAVGETVSVIATLNVAPGVQEGDILNATADAWSGANDPNSSNNSASAAATVTWWDTLVGATGPGGTVYAAAVVNDTFYAGGTFGVRRWNGASWQTVGTGGPGGTVYALLPDGRGGLYAGGNFTNIGPRLAHWNGSTWSSVGGGLPGGTVYALTLLGSDLYVGGQFNQTSTLTGTNNIALWDGSAWHKVGLAGISGSYGPIQPVVRALTTDGTKLYVGGTFSAPAANVVAWNPANALWEPLGGGVDLAGIGEATVRALAVLDGRLYVGGTFTSVDEGALETKAIAAWDLNAARWLPVGGGMTGSGIVSVNALAISNNGELVAGGVFAGVVAGRVAKWNGATWTPLGQGINDGAVNALAVNNNQVFVGGSFTGADGMTDPTTPLVAAHNATRYYYPSTDLTLALTPSTAEPTSGTNYRYTLTVRNQHGYAKAVAARLELPDGVSFVSGANCSSAGASGVVCQFGNLAEGTNVSVNVNVHLAREVRGVLQARAWAGAYQQEQQPADNAAVSTVTAIAQAGLHVTLDGLNSGTAGGPLSYQAAIINNGPALAFNAVLTFTFSGGVAVLDTVSGLTCTPVENYADRVTVVCPLGDMLPGESASGQFNFTIGAATRGTLQGVIVASSTSEDSNTADNRATVDTVVTADADIQVALDAPLLLYLPSGRSQELYYLLHVMHGGGPSLAQHVVLTQTLPAETLFISADSGCSYQAETHQVVCILEQLRPGTQAEFAVRVAVPANLAHGSILEAQLTATSDVVESDPANNTATTQTRVTTNTTDVKANLKLTQVAGPAVAGTTAFYTLTVYNQGTVAAQKFTITDLLPDEATLDLAYTDPACKEASTPGTVQCTLNVLEVGQSRQVVVAVRIPANLAEGIHLTNQAEVQGSPEDDDLSDNTSTATATVTTAANLILKQSSSHQNPTAGELITFTLTIVNRGPSMARGVELSNTPPVGLVLQNALSSQGSCDTTGGVAACTLGNLLPMGTATVELVMFAGVGTVTNTVQVSALTFDPRPDNNTADAMVAIESGAPSSRTFGGVTVNANAFIALPNGDLQAFGNVWIGNYYYLAETTDSLIIHPDGNHFDGEGTVAMREGEYPLFTGHFNGVFSNAGDGIAYLYPKEDVAYHLTGIGNFEFDPAQPEVSIERINLVSGQADGSSAQIVARPRKMTLAIPVGDFSIWPGPIFDVSVESFSFNLAGFTTVVETAEFRPDGIYVTTAELILPEAWGGLVSEIGDLLITPNDLRGTAMTIPLPNLSLVGEPVTTCAAQTGGTTVAVLNNSVSLIYAGGGYSFLGKGQLCVIVPNNTVNTPISFSIDTNGNFRAQADLIELNIATARLTMREVAIGNNGLSVSAATLVMPPSLMTSTITLQQVAVTKDGLRVGGGAFSVTMPDFGIGDTVRFERPIVTLKIEGLGTSSPRYAFAIDTTLRLNLPQNAQQLRVTAEIDTSGKFKGTVQGLSLAIASARLDIPTLEISNDGLFADVATLTLPPSLGGVSGKLAKIRIDKHGLTVGGGGVSFPLPDVKVAGFSVTGVLAEFEIAADRTFKLKVSGTMQIAVKNVSAMASGWFSVNSQGRMDGAIDSFSLSVAGLEMRLINARIVEGTLFFAEASLKVPPQWGGMSVAVYNVSISSSGIRIGGGRFEVPTIRVGSVTIGGLYGELREEGNGYVIGAGGTFMVPGLGGPAGCGLKVGLVIYVNRSGNTVAQIYPAEERPDLAAIAPSYAHATTGFALREVKVGLVGCRIPIGQTGFYLTRVEGTLTLTADQTVIEIGVTVASEYDLVRGDADLRMQFRPWQMDFGGSVTLLYFIKVAEMNATMKSGYFSATFWFKEIIMKGDVSITAWTDDGRFHLAGHGKVEIVIPKGLIVDKKVLGVRISIPPSTIPIAEIGAEFGEFKYGHDETAWGVKGWVKYWEFKIAAYVDTKGHVSCCGGEKEYKLVTPPQLERIRALKEGTALGVLALPAARQSELAQYTIAPNQVLITQTVPYETQVMFILSRPVSETVPVLLLQDPQGRMITPDFQPADVFYTEEEVPPDPEDDPQATPSTMMVYVVPEAQPGDWTAILDGISGEPGEGDYIFTVIGSIQPPTLTDPMVVNTGHTSAHAEWNLTALEITPTLDIYVNPGPITTTLTFTNTEGELVTQEEPLFSGFPVAEDVPTTFDGSRTSVDLDLSDLESGTYWVWFRAEDWRFPPTQAYAPAPIVVTHEWQDAWTAGLAATADITFTGEITADIPTNLGYRALLVSWNDHPNPDVDTYRLRIGTQPDVVEQTIEVGDLDSVYLQNLTPGQIYYLTVEAVDEDSGRISLSEQIAAFAEGMNYTLTADRTEFELIAGQSVDLDMILSVNADPAPESVFFTPVTLPDGVGLTLPDTPITPTVAGMTIPVTLATTDSMPEGIYQVPIVTTGGGVRRELTLQLTVHEPRVFVSAGPDTVVLGEEETQAVTLSAIGTYGKNTPVTLSLENFPAGLVYDLNQASIRPGETATMTLRDTWLLEPGDYSLQVRVGDGLIVTRVPITLTVAKPFFDLTADLTSLSIIAGERAVFPVRVTGVNLSTPLQLALDEWSTPVEGGHAGLAIAPNSMPTTTLTLTPDAGRIDRTIYLIVETAEGTPSGTYVQHIQGTGALRTRNLNFEVAVYEFGTQVADLGITQEISPTPAPIGGLLTYILQVGNHGPVAAYNVTLTDTLPDYVTLVSATLEEGTCTAVAKTVTCNLRALRPGGSTAVTLVTRLNPALRMGQELVNSAEVRSDQPDPVPGNNIGTTTVLVEAASDVQVTVWNEARPATSPGVIAGTEAVYHIAVANLGPSYAYAVQLTSALPEGTTYVSHDAQQGECAAAGNAFWCTVGTLQPGQTDQVELVVAVDPTRRGILEYTLSVYSQEQDPQPDNNTASVAMPVVAKVDLAVGHHTVAPKPVVAGADLTYQLVVTNTGDSAALNVVLTDTLPANVTVQSVTAGQGSCDVRSNTVTCRLGTLPSQHAASINLSLKVNPAVRQPIHNFAVVSTLDRDVNPANNSTSHSTLPVASADMAVSLTSMPGAAVAGTTLVYLASARNLGPSHATDAEITITLPTNVTVQTITPMQGTCHQTGQVVTCKLGDVQAGVSVPVNILTTVDSNFLGTLEAVAGTQGEETDLTPDSNTKTLSLPVNAYADLDITLAGTEQIWSDRFAYMVTAYTYTVANAGPSIATGVVVTSTLAEETIFGYAVGAECESSDTRTTICRLDPLMSGESLTFTLYVLLKPELNGPAKHTAIVGSDAYDPDPANNSAGFNALFKPYYLYIPLLIRNEGTEPDGQ